MTLVIVSQGKKTTINYYGKHLEYKTQSVTSTGPSHGPTTTDYSKVYI